jgi:RNA polymerase sigma-70 factor (ECF subfamily)
MASRQEMSDFLAAVERRAFKHALYAVRDEEVALDLVQDAMMRLAEKYADKPAAELPMLFQRILQNATTDHFRRQKVRNLWTTLLSSIFP